MATPPPDGLDIRDYGGVVELSREPGRIRLCIKCPFCQRDVIAHLWSLAGCGKRCRCGAVLGSMGQAWRPKDKRPKDKP